MTTLDELLDEGEQMDHCVGSYVDSCYNGDSRIVSLRCQWDGARSTLELGQQWVEDRVQVYVKQHCGNDNESPPISLDSAARMLVQQLNSTEMDWWDCLEHLIPRSTANVFRHRMQAWMFEALGIREDVALAE